MKRMRRDGSRFTYSPGEITWADHDDGAKKTGNADAEKSATADIAKVGPEGYIHGYICVRPPCGPKYTEAKFNSNKGSVDHQGTRIGKMRKNTDGTYSMTHFAVDGTKTRLTATHATRGDAALSIGAFHDVDVMHREAAAGPVKESLSEARVALAVGDEVGAMTALVTARDAAAVDGNHGLASHVDHVRTVLAREEAVEPKPVMTSASTAVSPAITHQVHFTRSREGAMGRIEARDAAGKRLGYLRAYDSGGDDKPVIIQTLKTEAAARGHGIGTALMNEAIADYGHRDINIRPTPFGGKPMNKKQLQDFYGKFGFKQDREDPGLMTRPGDAREKPSLPQAPSPPSAPKTPAGSLGSPVTSTEPKAPKTLTAAPKVSRPRTGNELWKSADGETTLSAEDKKALARIWYSPKYMMTNMVLRKQDMPHDAQLDADIVIFKDAIHRSAPFQSNAVVYRSISYADKIFGDSIMALGTEFSDKGFISVTADRKFIDSFSNKSSANKNAVITITMLPGTHALKSDTGVLNLAKGKSVNASEVKEYTLPPGTKFRITSDKIEIGKNNFDQPTYLRHVSMEVIPESTSG